VRPLLRAAWLAAFPVTAIAIEELALDIHARFVSGLHPERAFNGGTAFGMVFTTPALLLASVIGVVGVALFVRAIRRERLRLRSPVGIGVAVANLAFVAVLAPFWAFCVRVLVETHVLGR
jgi:hypothetical protein